MPDLASLRTRQLEPIVRQYVNADICRSVPELQRSIVKLIGHDDPQMRKTPLQVARMYGIPQALLLALVVAYTRDRELERQAEEDRRIALRVLERNRWERA